VAEGTEERNLESPNRQFNVGILPLQLIDGRGACFLMSSLPVGNIDLPGDVLSVDWAVMGRGKEFIRI
jgi:hypothetical protein